MSKLYFLTVIVFLVCSMNMQADESNTISLPAAMQAGGTPLVLNGSGTQIKFIIKIYVAGLYLSSPSRDAVEIIEADEPMAIRIHFVQTSGGNRIVTSWNKSFDRVAEDGYPTRKESRELFNTVFSSGVKKNSAYDIVYIPGSGTIIYLDEELKSEISGIDFKKAVFAFWLGSTPASAELKDAMLGGMRN